MEEYIKKIFESGDIEEIKQVLFSKDKNGQTPLYKSAKDGQLEVKVGICHLPHYDVLPPGVHLVFQGLTQT